MSLIVGGPQSRHRCYAGAVSLLGQKRCVGHQMAGVAFPKTDGTFPRRSQLTAKRRQWKLRDPCLFRCLFPSRNPLTRGCCCTGPDAEPMMCVRPNERRCSGAIFGCLPRPGSGQAMRGHARATTSICLLDNIPCYIRRINALDLPSFGSGSEVRIAATANQHRQKQPIDTVLASSASTNVPRLVRRN